MVLKKRSRVITIYITGLYKYLYNKAYKVLLYKNTKLERRRRRGRPLGVNVNIKGLLRR